MVDKIEENCERLPATYANFLIMNDAVLYPTYNQPANDRKAGEVLQQAFPKHEIVGIDCRALIKQHGSLHCVTMQYPQDKSRIDTAIQYRRYTNEFNESCEKY